MLARIKILLGILVVIGFVQLFRQKTVKKYAAGIFAIRKFNNERYVFMIKRNYGHLEWSGVGGFVNPGESIVQGAIREAMEESFHAIMLEESDLVGSSSFTVSSPALEYTTFVFHDHAGKCQSTAYSSIMKQKATSLNIHIESTEERWVHLNDLLELVDSNDSTSKSVRVLTPDSESTERTTMTLLPGFEKGLSMKECRVLLEDQ